MPKDPCSELAKTITELALNIGSRPGINTLAEVAAEMQKHIPEITRDEIVSSINEATTGYATAKTALQKKLDTLKREARNDAKLRAAVGMMEKQLAGTAPPPKPKAKPATPAEIKALRQKRDGLARQIKANDPTARERVKARIAELDKHIAAGTTPAKRTRPAAPADLTDLRTRRDKLLQTIRQRDMTSARREKLEKRIATLEAHISAKTYPTAAPRPADAPEIALLRQKRAALQRRVEAFNPKRIVRMEARVQALESHLKAGTLPPTRARSAEINPQATALAERREELLSALRHSDEAIKRRYLDQINSLTERLENGVEVPPPKPTEQRLGRELERLVYVRDGLKRRVNERIQQMKPRTFWQKTGGRAAAPFNLARSLMTSLDLSAVFRQGGFITFGHPVRAAKNIPAMLKAFASEKAARSVDADIRNRPNAPLYDRAKLYLAPADGSLSSREEAFMSRIAEKIPGVAGSQRAYITFLNRLRADSFDAMAETLGRGGDVSLTEARAVANYINIATGRGALGALEASGPALSTVFFSPRLVASRFQLLLGQPFLGGNAATRKLIAAEYGRFLIGVGVVYALGALAGAEIEKDPRSSDFGKLRFGDTRVDPLMGLAQVTVLLSRLVSGKQKTVAGKVYPIRGTVPYGKPDATALVGRFLRYKFSPLADYAATLVSGRDAIGKPTGPLEATGKLVIPLGYRDIGDVMEEHGIAKGTVLEILNLFGMGLQHYGDEPSSK